MIIGKKSKSPNTAYSPQYTIFTERNHNRNGKWVDNGMKWVENGCI